MDAKMAGLEAEAKALTGNENKKLRTEKNKEKKALKDSKEYIDACKVVQGKLNTATIEGEADVHGAGCLDQAARGSGEQGLRLRVQGVLPVSHHLSRLAHAALWSSVVTIPNLQRSVLNNSGIFE